MKIGETYQVTYTEIEKGHYLKEEMRLIKISKFENKEIYIFLDEDENEFVTYNHKGNIDWDFMKKIRKEFDY